MAFCLGRSAITPSIAVRGSRFFGPLCSSALEGTRQVTRFSSSTRNEEQYRGTCHCRALQVTLESNKTPTELGSRTCSCSFCRLHGASWTSDAKGKLTIHNQEHANRYRMGHGTAQFLTCKTCGVATVAVWRREHDGKLFSVVRVQSLDEKDGFLANELRWSVEHESREERLARRERTWTPVEATEDEI